MKDSNLYTYGFHDVDKAKLRFVGGKGANLGELSRIEGIRVPDGFCISTEAFKRTIGETSLINELLSQLSLLKAEDRYKIREPTQVTLKFNWSTILSEAVNYEYSCISFLFSSVEGITLEQYIIRQKIEKAKELLFYDELSLSEIADRLGYSSVAHLSSQFKKVTRFTASELKKSRELGRSRKPLDSIL